LIDQSIYIDAAEFYISVKDASESLCFESKPRVILKGSFPYFAWTDPEKCDLDITIVVEDKFEIEEFSEKFFKKLAEITYVGNIIRDKSCFKVISNFLLIEINFARASNNFGRINIMHPHNLGLACPEPFVCWITSVNEPLTKFYKSLTVNELNDIELPINNAFSQDIRRFKELSSEISQKTKLKRIFTYIGVVYIRYSYDVSDISYKSAFEHAMMQLSLDLEMHSENRRDFVLRNPCDPAVVLSNNFSEQLQHSAELAVEIKTALGS